MKLKQLAEYFESLLHIEETQRNDSSLNGLQVGKFSQDITRIAFSVDAGLEIFKRAVEKDAQLLFVHHGIFWGKQFALTGIHHDRISYLSQNSLALFAVHLPLDMHPEVGNNAVLASQIGLKEVTSFGNYHGIMIGQKGILPEPKRIEDLEQIICGPKGGKQFPFGSELNKRIGIISGSAPREAEQAISEDLDCYITGEPSHEIYHLCMEGRINVLFCGHYVTETAGVKALCEKTKKDTGIDTVFIDMPTGL
jgi:dinuclear metal center YbgI/SA1388 family protein